MICRRWLKSTEQATQFHTGGRADGSLSYEPSRSSRLLVTADPAYKTTITSCVNDRGAPQNYYPTPRNMSGGWMKPSNPLPSIPSPTRPYHGDIDLSAIEATSYDPAGQYADHIYESPNFERRSAPGASTVYLGDDRDSCSGAQYFELESDDALLTQTTSATNHTPHVPQQASIPTPHNVVDSNSIVWRKSNVNNNHNSQSNVEALPPLTPKGIAVGQRCSFPGTDGPCRSGMEQFHHANNGHQTGGSMTS